MGIFKRKNKSNNPVTGFNMVHGLEVPLIPFGDNVLKSDVVMICIDSIASQCAKLKGRYIKVDENGIQTEKNGPITFCLKRKPNELMTPYQFCTRQSHYCCLMIMHLCIRFTIKMI